MKGFDENAPHEAGPVDFREPPEMGIRAYRVAKAAMITVAENYEIVEKRAEAREAHVSMPNYPKQRT
jgi:hypothetical protein